MSKKILGYLMWTFWGPFYLLGYGIALSVGKLFSAVAFCFNAMAEIYEGEQDDHELFYWKLFAGTVVTFLYITIALEIMPSHWVGWLVAKL
jgi:hypothetical protein